MEKKELTPKKKKTTTKNATKQSNRPWVKLLGSYKNADDTMRIELDWNEAFINQLKLNGFTGVNDEQIIQKYILTLYKQIAESLDSGDSQYE